MCNTVHVLLVEDDEVEAEAIQRAFRKHRIANPITVAHDGVEALKILRGEAGHSDVTQPFIILLDINMPRMGGLEFLVNLRQDPLLRRSIVFVLTTSDREEDKLAAYNGQVAGYLLKTRVGEEFLGLIEMLDVYWRVIEFPPEE